MKISFMIEISIVNKLTIKRKLHSVRFDIWNQNKRFPFVFSKLEAELKSLKKEHRWVERNGVTQHRKLTKKLF